MRKALRSKSPRGTVSNIFTFNAPVKGWYTGENLAAMPAGTAYVLENWFPETDSISVRHGYQEHATLAVDISAVSTPVVDPVRTIMVHQAGGAVQFFACVDEYIFDVTGGDATAADITGLSSDNFVWLNFATSGGNYLISVNNSTSDEPQYYDGTTWTEPTITGATSADFNYVFSYKTRLFFIEKDTATVHYLPADSIAGAAQQLEVGAELTLGGTLIGGATLTQDAGDGPDDYCVFVSSEGEVVVYTGTDPSDAAAWAKVGTYRIGQPTGNRCLLKIGGDIGVLCSDGVTSLSRSILLDRAAAQNAAFSANISDAFADQYDLTGAIFGWQLLSWPIGHMAIVNVPITEDTTYNQFAMNVLSGAWCKFTGINSVCWALVGEDLYFGTTDGRVMLFGQSGADETTAITARSIPAWSDMKQAGRLKHIKNAQVFVLASGSFVLGMNIAKDFEEVDYAIVTEAFTDQTVGDAVWDTAVWDTDVWGGTIASASAVRIAQLGVAGSGYYLAPTVFAQTGSADDITLNNVRFLSMHVIYERGSIVG